MNTFKRVFEKIFRKKTSKPTASNDKATPMYSKQIITTPVSNNSASAEDGDGKSITCPSCFGTGRYDGGSGGLDGVQDCIHCGGTGVIQER